MTEPIYAEASEGYDQLFARATQLFIPALLRAAHIGSGQTVLDVATDAAGRTAADVYPDSCFDAVICQLGLMFFNDPARGLSEFHRVLRNGGWAAASVTTPPERSPSSAPLSLAMLPREQRS